MPRVIYVTILATLVVALLVGQSTVFAQEEEGPTCPPGVSLDLSTRGIVLEAVVATVNLDTTICNGSSQTEQVNFVVSGLPEEWNFLVRPSSGLFSITTLSLAPGTSQELRLRITGPRDQSAAEFVANLQLINAEGELLTEEAIAVEREAGTPADPGDIRVTSTFPFLRGPSTGRFEFELSVINNTQEDVSLNLIAQAPNNWSVSFVPAFGEEKLISSVGVTAGLSSRVKVRVTPPRLAPAGDFPILILVGNESVQSQIPLQVTLIGTFDLTLTTPDGRLNVDADVGDTTSTTLRIVNTGTADLTDLTLLSDSPSGWVISFAPSTVAALPANNLIDIPVEITPPGDTVPRRLRD